jgi:acetyl esterase
MATHTVQERDVTYLQHGDRAYDAHLYQPDGNGPFPAVVEVHGGAWTMNDRFSNAALDKALAASGIVVLALDFRMPPDGRYPDSAADVNYGIRWLKAHAAELHTRPELVGGIATSSGAQTLLVNALQPDDSRYTAIPLAGAPKIDAKLAFVAALWPIADPLARYHMAKAKGNDKLVAAHDAYWPNEEAMSEGNPQRMLERGDALVPLPPLFIAQGTNDDNVTPDMADKFAKAYRHAGGSVELKKFEGQPHSFIKEPVSPVAAEAIELLIGFIHSRNSVAR